MGWRETLRRPSLCATPRSAMPSACAGHDWAQGQNAQPDRRRIRWIDRSSLNRSGSIVNASKRKLSALFVVAGLMVMPLALDARAQSSPSFDRHLAPAPGFQHQRAVVPVAAGVRALRLRPLARVLTGEVRRLVPRAEHGGPGPVRQGRVPVRLQHVLPQRERRLHPGRQLRRCRGLDRPVRREGQPEDAEAGLVHATA